MELGKDIEIRFIVKENSCPLIIKNDMGAKLYLKVKKLSLFIMYALYLDTIDKLGGEIHNIDGTSGEIMCVKGTERDT